MHTTQSTLLRKFVGVSHFPYLHPSRCIGICSRVSMSSVVSSSTHTPMPMPMPTLTNIDFSRISVGTFQIKGPLCVDVVRTALGLGYRRIDTATVYKNETEVGQAMKESRIPREEIHITSKLGPSQMESSDTAYNGVRESLAKIGVDRLDSYLIHWPGRGGWRPDNPLHGYHRLQAWRGLERAKDEGLVEKIGVSNFEIRHLEELKKDWRIAPFSNQFELHPFIYSTQLPLIEWCRSHNIHVEAYSPLGSSAGIADLVSNEVIVRIGKECSQSPSNILLRWAYQHGFEILPKTKTLTRLNENAASCAKNWSLSVEQMSEIDGLEKKYGTKKYCWDPATIQ